MSRRKLLLVFNPKSGREEMRQNLFEVVDKLSRGGFDVTLYPTTGAKDAYYYICQSAEDYHYLVCSGGDGTLNEAVDALMLLKKRPVFGYIPSGTTNDFATSLGIPKDVLEAADTVINGEKTAIDIGLFGNDHYSYVAAFGLFTDVAYATPQSMKNTLGYVAYMLEGVKRLAGIKAYDCAVELDGEKLEGEFILGMVTNTTSLGGFAVPEEHGTILDDGLLELTLVRRPRRFKELSEVVADILGNVGGSSRIIRRKISAARFISGQTLEWTLDGEYGGGTRDVTVKCLPRALEIMLPATNTL